MASRTFVCPRCLERFQFSAWQNAAGQRVAPPPRPSRWQRFTDQFRAADPPGPHTSPEYRAAMGDARRLSAVCPNGHRLPPDYLARPTVVVGLVGLTGASKSTYLTVLLDQLYRAHAAGALRFALMLTGDRPLSEDLVQEAFVRVAAKLDGLRQWARHALGQHRFDLD